MSIFHEIHMAIFWYCVRLQQRRCNIISMVYISMGYSHMVGHAGSPARTVYDDVTLTRSKVNVKVTKHLNFRQLPITAHFQIYLLRHLRGAQN